jgi:CPA1 family monovalent cation:H+ antiporter
MQSVLILGAILIAFTAIGDAVSLRLRMPQSILLVMLGAGLSLTPVAPRVVIDPQLMLLLFLPPLIYSSGVGMSWRGFRNNLRPILLLAIGCVMFTAAAVAAAAHWLLALPWAVAFVLGAVVSPPDPVAPKYSNVSDVRVFRRNAIKRHFSLIADHARSSMQHISI